MSKDTEIYNMTTEERLQEAKQVNKILDKYQQMNGTTVNNQQININPSNNPTLSLIEEISKQEPEEESFIDGMMFDIILFFVIVVIGQILAVKYEMEEIKKISYILAIVLPYLI